MNKDDMALDALYQRLLIEEVFDEYTAPDMPKLRELFSRPSPFEKEERNR